MEKLRELTYKRGQIKAKLTRFKNFLDTSAEDVDLMQLKVRYEKLEEIWQAFEAVQSEIELFQEDTSTETNERDLFEELYYELSARAQSVLLDSQREGNAGKLNSRRLTDQVKLPVINLPSFSGNYDEWMNFYDTFRSLIHENEALPSIQKFHYLRSALSGEAFQVLASLNVSAENYKIAWDLLTQRYENKRYLISRHVKALFDMTRVERESSFSLRKLLDETNKNIRALTALGQPTHSWNAIILHLVTSKLDAVTYKDWESTLFGNELPDGDALINFLQHRCQILETVDVQRGTKTPLASFNKNKRSSYAAHVSINLKCKLCSKTHQLYQCKSFLNKSVPDRLADAKRLNLCINCLKSGHHIKDCTSSSCRTCNQRHNTLLHLSRQPSSGNSDVQGEELVTKSQPLTTSSQSESSLSCLTHSQEKQKTILLSTAVVWIYDFQGEKHLFRVLLDSGSQANFISERMAQFLQLKRKRGYSSVSGISGSETKVYHIVNATLSSRIGGYNVSLDFLVLPKISRDIPYLHIDISRLQLPSDIQLADPDFHRPQRVDGLLGAEVFWELLCPGEFKAHPTITTLRNSTLGWIFGGRINSKESPSSNSLSLNRELQNFL
ncbi:uncharacterized protein LOC124164213 isoform X3 [Ischnura elegans]|uniref:uncharacterized protein LOC124164213 isoform X3 n=1 Tax=Ischnura elegans TaxID=197161 RepID=UPI001ED8A522|nr:uncharacterized protein LOC124164213 isoform X3 [Ischnura elegans]